MLLFLQLISLQKFTCFNQLFWNKKAEKFLFHQILDFSEDIIQNNLKSVQFLAKIYFKIYFKFISLLISILLLEKSLTQISLFYLLCLLK